jgi:hypothetical protein
LALEAAAEPGNQLPSSKQCPAHGLAARLCFALRPRAMVSVQGLQDRD